MARKRLLSNGNLMNLIPGSVEISPFDARASAINLRFYFSPDITSRSNDFFV